MEEAKKITEIFLKSLGVEVESITNETLLDNQYLSVKIPNGDIFFSRNGDVLRSFNQLLRIIFEKKGITERFTIDINGYKKGQITKLEGMAKMLAERARSLRYDVELNPMNPFERMIIHSVLAGETDIKTESIGEGINRRVMIKFLG